MRQLPEIRLVPIETEADKPAGTKLGGKPDWIQTEWDPDCCGQPMTFLGQIDSLDIRDAKLPDSAIVYVFYCEKCFEVTSQLQCC